MGSVVMTGQQYIHQRSGWAFQRRANGEIWIQTPSNELAPGGLDYQKIECVLTKAEFSTMVKALYADD